MYWPQTYFNREYINTLKKTVLVKFHNSIFNLIQFCIEIRIKISYWGPRGSLFSTHLTTFDIISHVFWRSDLRGGQQWPWASKWRQRRADEDAGWRWTQRRCTPRLCQQAGKSFLMRLLCSSNQKQFIDVSIASAIYNFKSALVCMCISFCKICTCIDLLKMET